MRRMLALLLAVMIAQSLAFASIPKKKDTLVLPSPKGDTAAPPVTQSSVLKIDVYSVGTLVYQEEKLPWFMVVERNSQLIAAIVVTEGRRMFASEVTDSCAIPLSIQIEQSNGKVANWLIFAQTLCEEPALTDLSCDYAAFVRDVVLKLSRAGQFSLVCVDEYVGMVDGSPPECGP